MEIKKDLNTDERVDHLEKLLTTYIQKLTLLEQKYNLLLTERFNSGSTSEE